MAKGEEEKLFYKIRRAKETKDTETKIEAFKKLEEKFRKEYVNLVNNYFS